MSASPFVPHPSRRALLAGGGALFTSAFLPRTASAAGARDPRLVVIVLHGALDGLAAVGPIGDPDYIDLHRNLAMRLDGPHPALPLDGFFALNPGMPNLARLYRAKQAAIVHAVATGYRERSHFDGQDVLESGMPGPGATASGWLNRALSALPRGDRVGSGHGLGGLAVGTATPLVLRGPAPILGWAPAALQSADDALARRVVELYTATDPVLARSMQQGLEADRLARGTDPAPRTAAGGVAGMRAAAAGAARLMAAGDGPRVGALVFDGWDTHAGEGGATGRLMTLLGGLDGALADIETGLGPAWGDTVVVVVTEFGRTARINGTEGTDHGTGTVAFLAGGAVAGGRVIVDWPGLKTGQLYDGRDLAPTTDLRAVLKGVLADHLGLTAAALGTAVFPGTTGLPPMRGLLA